jgi:hypothetical protein
MTLPPPGPRPAAPRTLQGRQQDGVADPLQTVDRAMDGLAGLADRPLPEHVAVFERIHSALGEALAAESAVGEAFGGA